MRLILDIETDNLDVAQVNNIWCIVTKNIDTGEIREFSKENLQAFPAYISNASSVIGHNIIHYDYLVLERFYPGSIDPRSIVDTLVLSHLLKYRLDDEQGHSLEAWGERFNLPKHPSPDFQVFSPEMLEYCIRDVEITHLLSAYLMKHLTSSDWKQAIETEMAMAWICLDMHLNGFRYDKPRADRLKEDLARRLEELDKRIGESFPPKIVPVREITPKLTKHGTISKANLPRHWTDLSHIHANCPFTLVRYESFNPGSPTQIVQRLDAAGWKPTVRTTSGKSFRICEENLATLPDTAPVGCRLLVERMLIAARVRTLTEWEGSYDETDGRIHGTFNSIGTWPGRMAHRKPNLGNVATKKSIKYKGAVLKQLATDLGERMRGFWICDSDNWLVGTDMEAAHVRLFAHYIDDKEFTQAVISGDKKLGTDVHSRGAALFKHLGCDRDNHKTFIFSFFNGAGPPKVAEIFGCSLQEARRALELYRERYPGLGRLMGELIPVYAKQGWFPGLDGRKVYYGEEHGMFAGMLQSGESIVMKMANILWRQDVKKAGYDFKQVNLVHDEFVTEVRGGRENAEAVGQLQSRSIARVGELLKLKCPLAGEYKTGKNWLDVH